MILEYISQFKVFTIFSRQKVILGSTNLTNQDSNTQIKTISKITIHPKYNFPESYFDISVLTLDSELNLNEFVSPICLPQIPSHYVDNRRSNSALRIEFQNGRLKIGYVEIWASKFCNQSYAQMIEKDDNFEERVPNLMQSSTFCSGNYSVNFYRLFIGWTTVQITRSDLSGNLLGYLRYLRALWEF